jgi:hypothetical protein
MNTPIVSADSHVVEPANLWVERLDSEYRDRAPRIFWDEERRGWFSGAKGSHRH